jgi:ketosteroid isomerase-like protein
MSKPVTRATVEAFYKAYAECDGGRIDQYLDDDVELTISGPIDVLPFCGTRRGKAAVLDLIERKMPQVFRVSSLLPEAQLIDGDRVATLMRLAAKRSDGRIVSYRLAHFIRFRDGRIVELVSLIDSFNAVEQVLGHPLDVHEAHAAESDDLIAV